MLELTKTSDKINKRLSVLVYGDAGAGKTTLVDTLDVESDSDILYVAADPGHLAIQHRNFVMAQPRNWEEVEFLFSEHLPSHKSTYKWVVIDGLNDLGEMCLKQKMAENRDGRAAYGEMARSVKAMVKYLRDMIGGPNVLFITHQKETPDSVKPYGPLFPGNNLTNQLPILFDEILALRTLEDMENGGTVRKIQTKPEGDNRFITKDRSGKLEEFEEANLGKIYSKIYGGK